MMNFYVESEVTPLYNAAPSRWNRMSHSRRANRIAKVAELVDALDLGSSG